MLDSIYHMTLIAFWCEKRLDFAISSDVVMGIIS